MTPNQPKQWWAPVWQGLVMDAEAKHYRNIKSALWLYLYLLLSANRRTGLLVRKIQTISTGMGISRDLTVRWLNILRSTGYIATTSNGRYLTIQILRWKGLADMRNRPQQRREVGDFRSGKDPTSVNWPGRTNPEQTGRTWLSADPPNETKIKILKNETQKPVAQGPKPPGFTAVGEIARQEFLARELATALADPNNIHRYRTYCRQFPEWLLRKILAEVQHLPASNIHQSRGALFTHLLHHYVTGTTENPGG